MSEYLDAKAELDRGRFAEMQDAMRRDHLLELLAVLPLGDEPVRVLLERLSGERRERADELIELLDLGARLRGER
jgi:hypothetical protein